MRSLALLTAALLLAPIAAQERLTVQLATQAPVPVGTASTFTGQASGGSGTYTYRWQLGDGTITDWTDQPAIEHTYTKPGHYPILFQVRDGMHTRTASFVQTVHRPLLTEAPLRSSSVVFHQGLVWVANPDQNTVTAIDPNSATRVSEIAVGAHPVALAFTASGELWVTNNDDATISRIDSTKNQVIGTIDLPHAAQPWGLIIDGDAAFCALEARGEIARIDVASATLNGQIVVGPRPRHLGMVNDEIWAARFISPDTGGEIYRVARDLTPLDTHTLAIDPGPDTEADGRGLANYLGNFAISPDGQHAWIPCKKDNIERGLTHDGLALTFENTVRTMVAPIQVADGTDLIGQRIDFNDRTMAQAVCFTPLGNYLIVAQLSSNQVEVRDAYTGEPVGGTPVGLAPQGLAMNEDGSRLFVHELLSRSLTIIDTAGLLNGNGALLPIIDYVATAEHERLSDEVLYGKQLFYDADDRRLNLDGYISCAACHLDGGHDGRTWDFTDRGEGLRNTTSLHGRRGTGHGPVHWTANFDEIHDFEHDMRGPFGGTGLLDDEDFNSGTRNTTLGELKAGVSEDLDALAAYVTSLNRIPPSPWRQADGSLTTEAVAGREIFSSLNCQQCHSGDDYTDSVTLVRHNIGTIKPTSGQRLGGELDGIDTPTLLGIWSTAPYLHDGSAPTLDAVFEQGADDSAHGVVRALSADDRAKLIAFLQALDGSEPAVPPLP